MGSKNRKVFIVSNGGHDYHDAERFGELVFCTEGSIRKDDIAQMYRELMDSLDNAEPSDYIMVTSLASLCMLAAFIMGAKFGELHLLIHKDGRYIERDVIY